MINKQECWSADMSATRGHLCVGGEWGGRAAQVWLLHVRRGGEEESWGEESVAGTCYPLNPSFFTPSLAACFLLLCILPLRPYFNFSCPLYTIRSLSRVRRQGGADAWDVRKAEAPEEGGGGGKGGEEGGGGGEVSSSPRLTHCTSSLNWNCPPLKTPFF